MRPQGYVHNPLEWVDPLGLVRKCIDHFPEGDLDWSRINYAGENALDHVMRHDVDIPNRSVHSVFSEASLDQVEDAWNIAKKKGIAPYIENPSNGNWIYDIPYPNVGISGRKKGAAAENSILDNIRIIVEPGTNWVVSVYPFLMVLI